MQFSISPWLIPAVGTSQSNGRRILFPVLIRVGCGSLLNLYYVPEKKRKNNPFGAYLEFRFQMDRIFASTDLRLGSEAVTERLPPRLRRWGNALCDAFVCLPFRQRHAGLLSQKRRPIEKKTNLRRVPKLGTFSGRRKKQHVPCIFFQASWLSGFTIMPRNFPIVTLSIFLLVRKLISEQNDKHGRCFQTLSRFCVVFLVRLLYISMSALGYVSCVRKTPLINLKNSFFCIGNLQKLPRP